MHVKLWGTRGSVASPGPETTKYGGNTSCVEVRGRDGTVLVLDAGTGIRRLGDALPRSLERVDILLTHLHLDHLQGIGFFSPLRRRDVEVHIWGPASTTLSLRQRLARYLSPPLFPVYIRDLAARVILHEVASDVFQIGEFTISSSLILHVDTTAGFRINSPSGTVAYLPDHEPALGVVDFPAAPEWTSGYDLAAGADLLIHDCQYTDEQYRERIGWGHSSMAQAFKFAQLAEVERLVPFHHDPTHSDADLDRLLNQQIEAQRPTYQVTPGVEGATFQLD
ncbi:MAG: MBL fold metallo-hydrolase [Candidatus Promineifilaceae bacterium]|nr:MBL fold metallo-hydrolase [Candidatus Promineifilaceae bacterium]